MDENKGKMIKQQGSMGSDSTIEDSNRMEVGLPLDKRICLVGNVKRDLASCSAAQSFGVPVVTSENGYEYIADHSCSTVFILETFEGDVYETLYKSKHPVLGPIALQQLVQRNEKLPNNTRPLYNLSMSGVVVCFTGFRNKVDLTKLVPMVHHMGGSIRKDMSSKVTHLIANVSGGDKYQYAVTFRVPIMNLNWTLASWERRHDINFSANDENFMT